MLISTFHWWLAWLLFWASATAPGDARFVNCRIWFFRNTACEAGEHRQGRWFEARDSGISQDNMKTLLIERERPGGQSLASRLIPPLFKLFLADIDGNGSDDLIAGVERKIRGRTWKRVYVYEARRPDFPPLWLGSRLSFVLDDFSVVTIRGKPGLRARERRFGRRIESDYLWYTFGFRTISAREDPKP